MIKSITKFFEEFMEPDASQDTEEDVHPIHFATAALLMEVSRSEQGEESTAGQLEQDKVLTILRQLFEFTDSEVQQLIELAEDASEEAHDLYSFTKLINEHYDYKSRMILVKNLWEVAYADGRIDSYEEHIIRRISGLVHLANADFIQAKILARG
mgnify:FL=1|jgi:uncharacterized tellurite resistance protein B-like protein